MSESLNGIVLRRLRFSDSSLIITWLTDTHGRLKTMAKGALRQKSPFAGKLDRYGRPEWNETEQVNLWQGHVQGRTARLYLKRNGGYVGIHLALGADVFIEQFTVGMLTDDGWQLLAWANHKSYDGWVKRAQAWLDKQKRRRRVYAPNTPALWVTPPKGETYA